MNATVKTLKTTTPQTFPPGYLDALATQAQQALFDWLKVNAPAHVLHVFDGAAWLQSAADNPTDTARINPAEIDATVLQVLKGLCAMGATFGDGMGTWSAALDEVQP
jgi:hypothetical protein